MKIYLLFGDAYGLQYFASTKYTQKQFRDEYTVNRGVLIFLSELAKDKCFIIPKDNAIRPNIKYGYETIKRRLKLL